MTDMTQAPTPGPLDWTTWSGGPRPHPPATRVRVRYRDGTEDEGASAFCDWLHSPRRTDPKDVVAYKVVRESPTAPVEASGSERPIAWVGLQGNRFSEKPVVLGDGEMWIGGRPIPDSVIKQTTPLALGGQQGEDAAWSWLNQHVECDPADRDYSADEMVDAFMAGAGRYDIWLKALERIAGEHQYRSGYCQTDITVEPALTAEEAQTVARDALSTTPARAEAQDEGAFELDEAIRRLEAIRSAYSGAEKRQALEKGIAALKAEKRRAEAQDEGVAGLSETYRFAYDSIRNGAPGLSDATCAAIARSINMKVSLAANATAEKITELEAQLSQANANGASHWSRAIAAEARAHPFPPPAADEDRVRIAVDPEDMRVIGDWINEGEPSSSVPAGRIKALWQAVRALKSTAAKEGGEG